MDACYTVLLSGGMGYMRHHAIVVTTWDGSRAKSAHDYAVQLGCSVSEVLTSPVNACHSFFVAPDGSKEGWPESDLGDQRRASLVGYLNQHRADGGSYFDWAVIQYGDEEGDNRMLCSDADPTLEIIA